MGIQPIRLKIGKRTIFNLWVPCRTRHGSSANSSASPARICADLCRCQGAAGDAENLIVSGDEGLDEPAARAGTKLPTSGQPVHAWPMHPSWACPTRRSRRSAAATRRTAVLNRSCAGRRPYRDAVIFNAAATLLVADAAEDWSSGAAMAAEALDSGAARKLLVRWIDMAV